jgi:hypothetical protein
LIIIIEKTIYKLKKITILYLKAINNGNVVVELYEKSSGFISGISKSKKRIIQELLANKALLNIFVKEILSLLPEFNISVLLKKLLFLLNSKSYLLFLLTIKTFRNVKCW